MNYLAIIKEITAYGHLIRMVIISKIFTLYQNLWNTYILMTN